MDKIKYFIKFRLDSELGKDDGICCATRKAFGVSSCESSVYLGFSMCEIFFTFLLREGLGIAQMTI